MRRYGIRDLVLHYQPIVWIPTGEVAMYECLARFIDANGQGHLYGMPKPSIPSETLCELFA